MKTHALHRNSRFLLLLILSLNMLLASSCNRSTPIENEPVDPIQVQLSQTPRANPEAETMAMVIARTFTAPQSLYERIDADLAAIRKVYGDSIRATQVRFYGEWLPSLISIHVDRARVNDSASHKWKQLDSLLKYYRMTDSSQQTYYSDSTKESISLQFAGILNAAHLTHVFGQIPVVRGVWTTSTVDHPDIYAIRGGDVMRYFFRLAYNDCYVGCIESEFSYFVSDKGAITYVGTHLTSAGVVDPRAPKWVDTAWIAKYKTSYTGVY